jgi:hypothetical protein
MNRADMDIDITRYKWREITGSRGESFKIRHDYTILGYDQAAGTLDLLVRWKGDGGHCPIHRHVSTTTVLVLAGEQHLWDIHPDGTRGDHRVRRAGDYALTTDTGLPHIERGGPDGAIVFFGNHAADGRLYEIFDEAMNRVADISMATLFATWQAHTG